MLDRAPEHDVYTLDGDTLPASSDYMFKIYEEASFGCQYSWPKNLFLSEIPPYDTLQTGMYRIRRDYVPSSPSTQAELNCKLDWFLLDSASQES